MKEFQIGKNDAGQRLDRFVAKTAPLLPSSLIQKYLRKKRFKVNGRAAARDTRLLAGDVVHMYINDEFFEKPSDENAFLSVEKPNLDIVYEDENILLVNKLPGVLCHSAGGFSAATLVSRIQAYLYQKREWRPREEHSFAPALCNRIDRNTGGIVIAAKNAQALRIINEKIKSHEIRKFYLCIVHTAPSPVSGTLTSHLFKDEAKNRVFIRKTPGPDTKTAVTRYRTVCSENGLSLVECELLTGRTHQIRAQLADLGTPLLGDVKYGAPRPHTADTMRGQALWSYKVAFSFASDSGILEYLAGREFAVEKVPFVEKYFSGIVIE